MQDILLTSHELTWREKYLDPQYASLTYIDMYTNESTDLPPFWQLPVTDTMQRNAYLTLAAAIPSLIMSFLIVGLYLRALMIPDRKKYRLARIANPHNHFIFFIQICAIFSSLMFIINSSLRAWGSPRHSYLWCDTSFMIIQIFGEPQCFLEIFFLAAILVSVYKPDWLPRRQSNSAEVPPFVFYSSLASFGISITSAFCCMVFIPVNPKWGSRGDPSLEVWCWIPAVYPDETTDAVQLVAAQFLTFYCWIFLCPFVGVLVIYLGLRSMEKPTKAVKAFFRYRLLYSFAFALIWVSPLLSRIQNAPDSPFHKAQAFCEPILPFFNGLIFLFSEVIPRLNKRRVFNGANLGFRQLTTTRAFAAETSQTLLEQNAENNKHSINNDGNTPQSATSLENNRELQESQQSFQSYGDHVVSSASLQPSRRSSQLSQKRINHEMNASSDDDYDDDDDSDTQSVASSQGALPLNAVSMAGTETSIDSAFAPTQFAPPPSEVAHRRGNQRTRTNSTGSNNNNNSSLQNANDDEQDAVGLDAVMHNLEEDDRVKAHGPDVAQIDNVRVLFDDMTQSWTIEIDPKAQVSAASIVAKLQAIKFVQFDSYVHGAIMSFLCGFSDLTGAALLHFYTTHITGNIASWALYIGGMETKTGVMRHGWGYVVYLVGAGVSAEFFRRFNKKDNGARFLLFWTWFWLIGAMVAARTHENIGSTGWDDSSAAWVSGFLMVFALSGVNVYQRVANTGPIFTLQTGNTTAIAGDIVMFLLDRPKDWEAQKVILRRIRGNFLNIACFTIGAVLSAICAAHKAELCFAIPALLSTICLWIGWGVHSIG